MSRTDEPHDIVAATPPADATAEPMKPDARRLARVARRRQHEAGLCTQKRKVADEGGAVNTRRQGACKEHGKEAVRVSRVMGAVAWRARALQGAGGRAAGRTCGASQQLMRMSTSRAGYVTAAGAVTANHGLCACGGWARAGCTPAVACASEARRRR